MKRIFLCLTICLYFFRCDAQDYKPLFDSIQAILFASLQSEDDTFIKTAYKYDSLAKEYQDTFYMGKGQNFLGMDAYFKGDNIKSITYYLEALPYFIAVKDTFFIGLVNNNIGASYAHREEPEKAIEYYLKGMEKFVLAKDTTWIANTYNNIASQYAITDKFEEALHYGDLSIDIFTKRADSLSLSYMIPNQAYRYYTLGNLKKAKDFCLLYINGFEKFHEKESLAVAHNNLSKVYREEGKLIAAEKSALIALQLRKEKGLQNYYKHSYLELATINEEMGKNKKALEYYKQFKIYSDSTWILEKEGKITDLMTQYEVAEKDNEIRSLETEKELQNLRVNQLSNQRKLFGLGAFTLLLLAGGLAYFLRQRNKHNQLLEDKNKIIEGNLQEKETLLKEIHHRVKNNLQVVSSLLSLQSRSLKNEAAVEALKEGQNRVHSMALIHQHLYKGDEITKINMKEYVENLSNQVFSAHNISSEKVNLQLDIDDINLDIGTVVPLGLIMNELITNACKYAYPDGKSGKIYASLKEEGRGENKTLKLVISDDGIGQDETEISEGFGSRLIRTFVKKMEASIEVSKTNGYSTTLKIQNYS